VKKPWGRDCLDSALLIAYAAVWLLILGAVSVLLAHL